MRDTHRHTRRMGFKGQGDLYKRPDGIEGQGEVGRCGHWDAEYDNFGFCRDDDCRRKRMSEALRTGQAIRTSDGTIVWAHS